MAQDSKIEWAEHTWNPVSGCTKISSGCKNCYAETIANRFWKDRKFTDVQTHSHKLMEPVKRKKPTTYFVNSMSDLFHEDVPFEFIDQVFAVMASTPQHTYQVLTKRPERMLEYLSIDRRQQWAEWSAYLAGGNDPDPLFDSIHYGDEILTNVWLGVSVENQEQADKRIPHLLKVPAKVRFLSVEPLLGPVDLNGHTYSLASGLTESVDWLTGNTTQSSEIFGADVPPWVIRDDFDSVKEPRIHWVIIGGESGSGARFCDIDWIRAIVQQCKDANVACFVKQLGSAVCGRDGEIAILGRQTPMFGNSGWKRIFDPKGGDIAEWPTDLQVREFPKPQNY